MCLMLQRTRSQVQVLKLGKSVQETSEVVLDFKTRQLTWQLVSIEVWKAAESRISTASSIDTLSVKVYEIQFFKTNFTPIREYVFRPSFLTTLNIYKDYFKDHQRLHKLRKCEAKFCSCKLWPETEFALIHLSLEEATMFVHFRVLWQRNFMIFIVWWTEELCNQHLSQIGDQVKY